MFNPFEKLTTETLEAFRRMGESYLVSQTYPRGLDPFNDEGKTALLFSQYSNLSQANIHLSAMKGDQFAALIDLEKQNHRNKLMEMMGKNSNYVLFANVIKSIADAEKRLNAKYKNNVRRYVGSKTNWSIPANEHLIAELDIAFGDLFVLIKFRKQQIRTNLDVIEKS